MSRIPTAVGERWRASKRRLADAGIDALVGHEMEFVLVGADGSRLPAHLWAQYGLAGVLEYEGFVRDVTDAATSSGVSIEQFHPEYGVNQFEISLTPQSPIAAADQLMLMQDDRRQGRHGGTACGSVCRRCRSREVWVLVHINTFHCERATSRCSPTDPAPGA